MGNFHSKEEKQNPSFQEGYLLSRFIENYGIIIMKTTKNDILIQMSPFTFNYKLEYSYINANELVVGVSDDFFGKSVEQIRLMYDEKEDIMILHYPYPELNPKMEYHIIYKYKIFRGLSDVIEPSQTSEYEHKNFGTNYEKNIFNFIYRINS
jgi:hypothetical protein